MCFFTSTRRRREQLTELKEYNVDLVNEMITCALTSTNISNIREYIRAAETIRTLRYTVVKSEDVPDIGKRVASKIDTYFYTSRTNESIADFLEEESMDEEADIVRKLSHEVLCGEDVPGVKMTVVDMIDDFLDSYFQETQTNDSIADFLEEESLDEEADIVRKLSYEVTSGEDVPGIKMTVAEKINTFLQQN